MKNIIFDIFEGIFLAVSDFIIEQIIELYRVNDFFHSIKRSDEEYEKVKENIFKKYIYKTKFFKFLEMHNISKNTRAETSKKSEFKGVINV